ncbi:hypothetical protein PVAND_010202 [Polypedilum vanderplanki]|uniref:phospholipase A2 n=1 Tax=Polypedilum vanderplanki TaxID=319348 RepID=A0A9J6CFM9_POLVA|nr:hypothetical protein PVAND_010202 [Polypedilum vanderplanki]
MIELSIRKPYCQIHTDRGSIQHVVLSMDSLKVRQVPIETIQTLENVCLEGNQLRTEIQGGLSFIYPGTVCLLFSSYGFIHYTKFSAYHFLLLDGEVMVWSRLVYQTEISYEGTIAKNYSDLGRHAEEDKCCRAHDNCYPQIGPGECLKSICNKGTFTRLHCDCDEKFRRCLSTLNTDIGNTLGAAFFNAVQVTCFDFRRPCSSHQRVGYNESEQEEICSRYKFRPSPRYHGRPTTGNLQNGVKRPHLI